MEISHYLEHFSLETPLVPFSPANGQRRTITERVEIEGIPVDRFTNEFWTSGQRQGSSIHEISYRACFKPQLPSFFIRLLTRPGDLVYDPFSGRGTTVIEAGLLGRRVIANDRNPLSTILARPRLDIPKYQEVSDRLAAIPGGYGMDPDIDLSMFFHAETAREIASLRAYLQDRSCSGREDRADSWIRMVATNRLTGHSKGFFSVYTLPPNQAVSPESQERINRRRDQTPGYRDTAALILRKTRSLQKGLSKAECGNLRDAGRTSLFLTSDSRSTPEIGTATVQLTVTSPPFLNIVQYSLDNWLRCWFNHIDDREVAAVLTNTHSLDGWAEMVRATLGELFRITKPHGWVAFEVGEIKKGSIRLDEVVVPLGVDAGFTCKGILINEQKFTKTSHIWGVGNNELGTNTNRIVLFRKDGA